MLALQSMRQRLNKFETHQGGAVLLLVLAAFLILTLAAMIVFEAGESSQAKMEVQTSADAAAYSQSVVKARSMNMISYANTAKRMYYAYYHTYFAALAGLVASTAIYFLRCGLRDLQSCIRGVRGTGQIGVEAANFATSVIVNVRDSRRELRHLDNYQRYLTHITPWWAFAEGVFRSTNNGAHISASWPPPPGTITDGMDALEDMIGDAQDFIDDLPDIPGVGSITLPNASSGFTDSLPVERADDAATASFAQAHIEYCAQYIGSPEQILALAEHMTQSESSPGISTHTQTRALTAVLALFPRINMAKTNAIHWCLASSILLGNRVLDYRVDSGILSLDVDKDDWLHNTSSMTFAYQHQGHSQRRENYYEHILRDHDEGWVAYESEGNWAIARSEIFFGRQADADGLGSLPLVPSFLGSALDRVEAGPVVAAAASSDQPHMWTPRWSARLRPMKLPEETLRVDLENIYTDLLPYFGMLSLAQGILDDDFALSDAARDLLYMWLATGSFAGDDNDDYLDGLYR